MSEVISRLLCWLGLHQPLVVRPSVAIEEWNNGDPYVDYTRWTSAVGVCGRDGCEKVYQWD